MEARGNIGGVPGGLYGPGNLVTSDTGLHPHWSRITGKAAGTNRYSHQQIDDGDLAGNFTADLAADFGSTGTTSAAGYPAYELTGRDDVPTGAIVKLTPAGDLSFLTFTYDGPGDGSGTALPCGGGCGTLAGLVGDECLSFAVTCYNGEFAEFDPDQETNGVPLSAAQFKAIDPTTGDPTPGVWTLVYWDVDLEAWTAFDFNWTGGSGDVVFTWDGTEFPTLTIGGVTVTRLCLSSTATFIGGPRNGLTGGAAAPDSCEPNDIGFRIACDCCWPDGYTGPGYYATDDDDCVECVGVLISDDPTSEFYVCDFTGVICSERFDTIEEADAFCEPPPPPVVPCTSTPSSAVMAVTAGTGACATSMDGLTATITPLGGGAYSLTFADPTSDVREVDISCTGDVWSASKPLTDSCQGDISPVVTVIDTTHLKISTTFGGALCVDCGNQTITVEITVTMTP